MDKMGGHAQPPVLCPERVRAAGRALACGEGLEVSQGPKSFPRAAGGECQFLAWLRVSHVILEEQEV